MEHFEELKKTFLMDITNIVNMDEIPPRLIINFDQTAINYVPTPMEKQGAKRVEMIGIDVKRQMTAVLVHPFQATSCHLNLCMKERQSGAFPIMPFP